MAFLPFKEARAIVRELKLKTQEEWREWMKSGKRPTNIPGQPEKVYRDDGWISYPDWLDYTSKNHGYKRGREFLPFEQLELKSCKEWGEWRKSGKRPSNVPSSPFKVYRNDGWISYPDWLGYSSKRICSKRPRTGAAHSEPVSVSTPVLFGAV